MDRLKDSPPVPFGFVSHFSFVFVLHVQFCKAKSRCTLSQVVHQQHSVTVSYQTLLQYSPPRLLSFLISSRLIPSPFLGCSPVLYCPCSCLYFYLVICSSLHCCPYSLFISLTCFLSSSSLSSSLFPFLSSLLLLPLLPLPRLFYFPSPPLDLHKTKCLHCWYSEMYF